MSVKASVASIALSGCPEAGAIRCRPEVAGRMSDAPQLQKLEEIVERAEGASLIESNSQMTVDGWEVNPDQQRNVSTSDGKKTLKQYGVRPTDESIPGMWGKVKKEGADSVEYWWVIRRGGYMSLQLGETGTPGVKQLKLISTPVKMNGENVSTTNPTYSALFPGGTLSVDVIAMSAVRVANNLTKFKKVFFAVRRSEDIKAYMIEIFYLPNGDRRRPPTYEMVEVNYDENTKKFSEL